ncbi:MAG: Gfo/Idh/MocA family oxidoreductase [Caldilineaceae bacterium]
MSQATHRKIKVGVVGCGVVATAYYLPYLMDHADLVAVCDLDPERTAACKRLFGAKEQYQDYAEMIKRADIEAVFILTGPGTHARFTIQAAEAGKHILLQKPMATNMADTNAIVQAVRKAGVKALVEPSSTTVLEQAYRELRSLIDKGVLGDPYWFSLIPTGPDRYHPSLGGNPYGLSAFYSQDSGGMLFDYPYAPTQIVTLLGACKSVLGMAKISVPERSIVPESEYTKFLNEATDPYNANYWDVVVKLPRTEQVKMGAPDNVFSLYEMANGAIGCFHVGRPFHPVLPGSGGGNLQIYGTEGNLFFGGGHLASIISSKQALLPSVSDDGWYHIPPVGDVSKAVWPKPTPGGFNYYHESSQHLIDCILEDREPLVNVEWGRHITEMMVGALESARTGQRYPMTSTLDGLVTSAQSISLS